MTLKFYIQPRETSFFSQQLCTCFLIYSNWRISIYNIVMVLPSIDMKWQQVYMCPPHPVPPHTFPPYPSGLSQSTSFECPASCIKLALVTSSTYKTKMSMMHRLGIEPGSPTWEVKILPLNQQWPYRIQPRETSLRSFRHK